MKFVTVDNDQSRLMQLGNLLKSVFPNCAVTEFIDPMLSAKCVFNHAVDGVLMEKVMRPADGALLQKVMLTNAPKLKTVILSEPRGEPGEEQRGEWTRLISQEKLKTMFLQ